MGGHEGEESQEERGQDHHLHSANGKQRLRRVTTSWMGSDDKEFTTQLVCLLWACSLAYIFPQKSRN